MKALLTIFLMIFVFPVKLWTAEWRIPQDYPQVSEALKNAVPGDTIFVTPGSYDEGTEGKWNLPENVSVIGLGASPADVVYFVYFGGLNASVILRSGSRLENLTLDSRHAPTLCLIWDDAVGVVIKDVVLNIRNYYGIETSKAFAEAEISNVTFRRDGHPSRIPGGGGMWIYDDCSISVRNCLFKDLKLGLMSFSEAVTTRYNCFDSVVEIFLPDGELDPTDIVGASGVDGWPYGPPYGSILIDAGDPVYLDQDGTVSDIGAVRYNQTAHLIGFGETVPDRLPGNVPTVFRAGDKCILQSVITKPKGYPETEASETADAYLFLDVYGQYWFWPSWRDDEVDFQTVDLVDGYYRHEELFNFTWPKVEGSASGLRFWASTIRIHEGELQVGPIACLEFGYE